MSHLIFGRLLLLPPAAATAPDACACDGSGRGVRATTHPPAAAGAAAAPPPPLTERRRRERADHGPRTLHSQRSTTPAMRWAARSARSRALQPASSVPQWLEQVNTEPHAASCPSQRAGRCLPGVSARRNCSPPTRVCVRAGGAIGTLLRVLTRSLACSSGCVTCSRIGTHPPAHPSPPPAQAAALQLSPRRRSRAPHTPLCMCALQVGTLSHGIPCSPA